MSKQKNSRIPQILFQISEFHFISMLRYKVPRIGLKCGPVTHYPATVLKGENLFIFKLRLHKVSQNFEAMQKFKQKDELISVIIIMQLLTTTYVHDNIES